MRMLESGKQKYDYLENVTSDVKDYFDNHDDINETFYDRNEMLRALMEDMEDNGIQQGFRLNAGNSGYDIIASCVRWDGDNGEWYGVVLARIPDGAMNAGRLATWEVTESPYQEESYHFGHYFGVGQDKEAEKDFRDRCSSLW